MTRADGRKYNELRPVEITTGFIKFAEGSVLIRCGDTVVLCNASVEERVPPHVAPGCGWVTAEYSMLPRANRQRSRRDIDKLKLSGRSAEIQRLIGRSLRAAVDRRRAGQRQRLAPLAGVRPRQKQAERRQHHKQVDPDAARPLPVV